MLRYHNFPIDKFPNCWYIIFTPGSLTKPSVAVSLQTTIWLIGCMDKYDILVNISDQEALLVYSQSLLYTARNRR